LCAHNLATLAVRLRLTVIFTRYSSNPTLTTWAAKLRLEDVALAHANTFETVAVKPRLVEIDIIRFLTLDKFAVRLRFELVPLVHASAREILDVKLRLVEVDIVLLLNFDKAAVRLRFVKMDLA